MKIDGRFSGGNNRARTYDPLLVRQMLSQLSYAPKTAVLPDSLLATVFSISYHSALVNTFLKKIPTFFQEKKALSRYFWSNLLTKPYCHAIILERHIRNGGKVFLIFPFYGGIAQLARAFGSYPEGRGFESNFRYHRTVVPKGRPSAGPVVKRLRHRPFTAVTRVRFSSGSPQKKNHQIRWFFFYRLFSFRLRIRLISCAYALSDPFLLNLQKICKD